MFSQPLAGYEIPWTSILVFVLLLVLVFLLSRNKLDLWNRMSLPRRRLKTLRHHFRVSLRNKMELMFEGYLNSDSQSWDFPNVDSPAWVFGRSYSVNYGKLSSSSSLSTRSNVVFCRSRRTASLRGLLSLGDVSEELC